MCVVDWNVDAILKAFVWGFIHRGNIKQSTSGFELTKNLLIGLVKTDHA